MSVLNPKAVYMNPYTGSVDFGAKWEAACDNGANWPLADLLELIEVEPDIDQMIKVNRYGIWKEV